MSLFKAGVPVMNKPSQGPLDSKHDLHANTIGTRCLVPRRDEPSNIATASSVHTPLDDPSRQIRLLQDIAKKPESPPSYNLITVDFDGEKLLPSFYAISYTWGDNQDLQTIEINGEHSLVGKNCFHALWQARQHYPDVHIWLDAICINQGDLTEKGAQVAMMGSIYQAAARVLVCVGPHADKSELVTTWAKDTEALQLTSDYVGRFSRSHDYELAQKALLQLDDQEEAFKAVLDFCRRRYWTRLWVAQEITLGMIKEVLCGEDIMSWETVALLGAFVRTNTMLMIEENYSNSTRVLGIEGFYALTESTRVYNVALEDLLLDFNKLECSDPRDRIYGLLSLAKEEQREVVSPDYTISKLALAIQVAKVIALKNIPPLLGALNICFESDEVKSWREDRASISDAHDPSSFDLLDSARACYTLKFPPDYLSRVRVNDLGQLNANFERHKVPHAHWKLLDQSLCSAVTFSRGWEPALCEFPGLLSAQCIMYKNDVAALVCEEARQGDVLLRLQDCSFFLVLRQAEHQAFDIVGQGFLFGDFAFRHGLGGLRNRWIQLEIELSAEDAVALLAPEVPSAGKKISLSDYLERFRHVVTAFPQGAARFQSQPALIDVSEPESEDETELSFNEIGDLDQYLYFPEFDQETKTRTETGDLGLGDFDQIPKVTISDYDSR